MSTVRRTSAPAWLAPSRPWTAANTSTPTGSPRAGPTSTARSPTRSGRTAGPSPSGYASATPRGTPSARCACTWPRTAATRSTRSLSLPPTRCARARGARCSTVRWPARSRSPPRAATGRRCSTSWSRCNAPPSRARGWRSWSTPVRSTRRWRGRPPKRTASYTPSRHSRRPGWWYACPTGGARGGRRGLRSPCASVTRSRARSAWTRCSTSRSPSRWATRSSPPPRCASSWRPPAGWLGSLRPYKKVGVSWLAFASSPRLGVCLADDMGLGKTIQVLGLLLLHKRRARGGGPPHLLVAPASLLANWQAEIERFAPSLATLVAHPSTMPARELTELGGADLGSTDLVMTTYGTLARVEALRSREWSLAILDEAQAIKNPGARQTQAVKALKARARIALTGTPVENRLGDLWSIYDFLDPGLLGSAREFSTFARRLAERPDESYAPLRRLIQPYLLRRLKTDRSIVADLPDKTEVKAFCLLSGAQAALYQKTVDELERAIAGLEQGIERRGLVLAYLMRFKQICNPPAHSLGEGP